VPIEPDNRRAAPDRRKVTRGGRRSTDIPLRSPDACPEHGRVNTIVIRTTHFPGYIRRRHCCRLCNARWWAYETRMDPLKFRYLPS
jgi:hypothetical protein